MLNHRIRCIYSTGIVKQTVNTGSAVRRENSSERGFEVDSKRRFFPLRDSRARITSERLTKSAAERERDARVSRASRFHATEDCGAHSRVLDFSLDYSSAKGGTACSLGSKVLKKLKLFLTTESI